MSRQKLDNMRLGASVFRSEDDSLVLKTINAIKKQDEKLKVTRRARLLQSSQKKDIFQLAAVVQEVCSVKPGFSIWKSLKPDTPIPKITRGRYYEEFFNLIAQCFSENE
jgi:hypothetical protein